MEKTWTNLLRSHAHNSNRTTFPNASLSSLIDLLTRFLLDSCLLLDLPMPCYATSCGRRPTMKRGLFLQCICSLLFFVCFSLQATAVAAASNLERFGGNGQHPNSGCPDCGAGGTCVPDISLAFGNLLVYYRDSNVSFPFRCECFEGYYGPLCNDVDTILSYSSENRDDDFLPDNFFLPSDGCLLDCQNEGKCISIFGGLSYACVCVDPFWGSECEFDGNTEPCDLDCSSIVVSASPQDAENANSHPRPGAFCVESPANSVEDDVDTDDPTCIYCEEITVENEPNCENLIDCKNGGVCKIDYQFVTATTADSSEGNQTTIERPLKCSSTSTITTFYAGEVITQTVWMDLPHYVIHCDCQVGFQGETCEEIDVCGGCQNDGYCISEKTPRDIDGVDDTWNFITQEPVTNVDFNKAIYDNDDIHDDDDDDDAYGSDNYSDNGDNPDDCVCYSGGCDQNSCGIGASCVGGLCNQNFLVSPMCPGGKCSQRHTANATCIGGDCDQTSAVGATCTGSDCFHDDIEAQTFPPNTDTMVPQFDPFCSCEYGFFGDLCQHSMTRICLFNQDLGFNEIIHEICLKAGGFCPFEIGDHFCANGGRCGSTGSNLMTTESDKNDMFSCICPSGHEGVHCEITITQAPTFEPTDIQPTSSHPSSSAFLPGRCKKLFFLVSFAMFIYY